MAIEQISDFRSGLDARKFKLSLPSGALVIGDNGHITQGAEFEKRKAYVLLGTLPSDVGYTFGDLTVINGIMVFGSALSGTVGSLPSPYLYQQLQHPAVLDGVTYNASLHAMTAVICSECFAGYAFVACTFADGYSYAYYNGNLIYDFTNGLVLPYLAGSNSGLAKALTELINRTSNYTAVQQPSPNNYKTDAYSLPGSTYLVSQISTTNAGVITAQEIDTGIPPVQGLAATGQITITTGLPAITGTITSTGQVTDGDTLTLGGQAYRFKNTMAQAYDVKIGASAAATLASLAKAINASGTVGTDYFTGTLANPNATAGVPTAAVLVVSAISIAVIVTMSTSAATYTLSGLSGGATGNLIASNVNGLSAVTVGATYATGFLTTTGTNVSDGDTVTIGGKVYTFKTTLTPTEGQVLIGGNAVTTLNNLISAINHTGIPGTDYYCAAANTQVSANATVTSNVVTVKALAPGPAGNSISTTKSAATLSWGNTTLTGGTTSTNLLAATVYMTSSLPLFCAAVAAAIDSNTGTSGYSAIANGNLITVTSNTANSFDNGASLSTTAVGQICVGSDGWTFSLASGYTSMNCTSVLMGGINILSQADTIGGGGGSGIGWTYTYYGIAVNSLSTLAAAVAASINSAANTNNNGVYVAVASGPNVYVSKVITSSTDTIINTVVNVSTGGVVTGIAITSLYLNINVNGVPSGGSGGSGSSGSGPAAVTFQASFNSQSVNCVGAASGGTPTYLYKWSFLSGSNTINCNVQSGDGSVVTFSWSGRTTGTYQAVFVCTATDAAGNTAQQNITVTAIDSK